VAGSIPKATPVTAAATRESTMALGGMLAGMVEFARITQASPPPRRRPMPAPRLVRVEASTRNCQRIVP